MKTQLTLATTTAALLKFGKSGDKIFEIPVRLNEIFCGSQKHHPADSSAGEAGKKNCLDIGCPYTATIALVGFRSSAP